MGIKILFIELWNWLCHTFPIYTILAVMGGMISSSGIPRGVLGCSNTPTPEIPKF
jgi:hypothetical protein